MNACAKDDVRAYHWLRPTNFRSDPFTHARAQEAASRHPCSRRSDGSRDRQRRQRRHRDFRRSYDARFDDPASAGYSSSMRMADERIGRDLFDRRIHRIGY